MVKRSNSPGRSPYGERGLKSASEAANGVVLYGGRSPYGERGLKSVLTLSQRRRLRSLSLRRAWIEIQSLPCTLPARRVALLTESVD